MNDLLTAFTPFLGALPSEVPGENEIDSPKNLAVYTGETLALPSREFSTDQIWVRVGTHHYASARVDELHFYGTPHAYGSLGLLILAATLSSVHSAVEITLEHSKTEVKILRMEPFLADAATSQSVLSDLATGLISRAYAFVYRPRSLQYRPIDLDGIVADGLPVLQLTNRNEDPSEQPRDMILGLGTDEGVCRLAEVFLNLTHPWQKLNEFSLESSWGYGGVGRDSAEVRFWLPGAKNWPT